MPALTTHLKLPRSRMHSSCCETAAVIGTHCLRPRACVFRGSAPIQSAGDTQVGQEIDKTLHNLTMTRLWGVESRIARCTSGDRRTASSVALTVPGNNYGARSLCNSAARVRAERIRRAAGRAEFRRASVQPWPPARTRFGCATGIPLQEASRRANVPACPLLRTAAVAPTAWAISRIPKWPPQRTTAREHRQLIASTRTSPRRAPNWRAENRPGAEQRARRASARSIAVAQYQTPPASCKRTAAAAGAVSPSEYRSVWSGPTASRPRPWAGATQPHSHRRFGPVSSNNMFCRVEDTAARIY